jgi:hypothetical protein
MDTFTLLMKARAAGLDRFWPAEPCEFGHNSEFTTDWECLKCAEEYHIRKKIKSNKKLRRIASGAQSRGLDFNISPDDIEYTECCPICSNKFTNSGTPFLSQTTDPSIDRIHNHLGYVKGNVRVICSLCNRLKFTFDATEASMIAQILNSCKTMEQVSAMSDLFKKISQYIRHTPTS